METTALTMFVKTVKFENQLIWIKPVCDFFNLNLQNQQRKLKNDPILRNLWIKKSNDLGKIGKNGMILLSKKGFIRWIQIINANTIEEKLREKFMQFQELIFDFLYGNLQDEEMNKFHYIRLQKLEKLYSKIGLEIKQTKQFIYKYLDNKYIQTSLQFPEQQQLNS